MFISINVCGKFKIICKVIFYLTAWTVSQLDKFFLDYFELLF